MTRISNKELVEPYDEPKQALHSLRKLFKTTSFDHSSSPEFKLFSDHEEQVEEEITETMTEPTMEEYMTKTREDYGSGIARLKFDKGAKFELKGQFLKELCDNTFSGLRNEDANEHIERVLEIVDLFTTPDMTQIKLCFVFSLSHLLERQHNGTSTRNKSSNTSDGLAAIQAQLNNLGRKIKKANEIVYVAQVGCELYGRPHCSKDCPLKEKGKTLEEAYYTQFGVPFPNARRYRAAALGFYQRDNGIPSYHERRQMMGESLSKFMTESTKRHDENSSLIKKIRASTDVAIRNQGASIKAFEIQIGQMGKVLQERGSESLPSSTETNPRDHVKSISTIEEADIPSICRIQPNRYIDCPLKEKGKTLEEAYYTQFGVPFPNARRYRAAALGFYQRDNGIPSYHERRQTMEESLSKFMTESTKRHDENSSLIKNIRASMDAAIRNQGALSD
uniref:Uncharacterized protein n=1 Tax=Tanacetum cinerariifolium TaxID=118510 RepID=A0A6L2J3Q8_TANCI|nr:hypothetical protein [Tanacetum cinerariifolium]